MTIKNYSVLSLVTAFSFGTFGTYALIAFAVGAWFHGFASVIVAGASLYAYAGIVEAMTLLNPKK